MWTAALGALLVRQWLDGAPLWLDEQMLALNLRERPVSDLAGPLWLDQSAPLGWLALQRLALVWIGEGEQALRALPLLFGLATLATAAWAGTRWLRFAGAFTLVTLCGLGTWFSYHALELKPYSADVFFGLALPALALSALDAAPHRFTWRQSWWWAAAALAPWLSTGAVLVAPACAVVLAVAAWRRNGGAGLLPVLAGASVWALSCLVDYDLVLRHASDSAQLQTYWAFAFPPRAGGLSAWSDWWLRSLGAIATKPGGAAYPWIFWSAALAGLALAWRAAPEKGLLLTLVPVSLCALALVRLVPLYERLSIWAVPALYAAVAVAVDAGVWRLRHARSPDVASLAALSVVALGLVTTADVARQGLVETRIRVDNPTTNHALDDRSGVAWLLAQRQPRDVVITTRLALPAIWWYGGALVADPVRGARLPDGVPVLEAAMSRGRTCPGDSTEAAFTAHRRALVYFGFRFDDVPAHFDDALLERASALGRVVGYRRFGPSGAAAVVDLTREPLPPEWTGPVRPGGLPRPDIATLGGCLTIRPAERW